MHFVPHSSFLNQSDGMETFNLWHLHDIDPAKKPKEKIMKTVQTGLF